MRAQYELFISKVKCFFGKHILDFENETEHHCYCRKKYVRKPVPKMPKDKKEAIGRICTVGGGTTGNFKISPKKKKVIRLPLCPTQGKLSFTEQQSKALVKKTTLRAYKCAWCPYWHRTSKKDNLKKH